MKRGTVDHPKLMRLAKLLGVRRHVVVGLCEMLWHLTARYTPAGDVGKWSDEEIASALDWPDEAGRLVAAFVSAGLLERHPAHRVIVHDWADHAEKSVHDLLKRRGWSFVTSIRSYPDISGHIATNGDISALPMPMPMPEPKPKPEKERRSPRSLACAPGFEEAWNAYGHREARADAEKAWRQTVADRPPLADLLEAITRYHATPKWQEGVRCHFATWLRKKRYRDETTENAETRQQEILAALRRMP